MNIVERSFTLTGDVVTSSEIDIKKYARCKIMIEGKAQFAMRLEVGINIKEQEYWGTNLYFPDPPGMARVNNGDGPIILNDIDVRPIDKIRINMRGDGDIKVTLNLLETDLVHETEEVK